MSERPRRPPAGAGRGREGERPCAGREHPNSGTRAALPSALPGVRGGVIVRRMRVLGVFGCVLCVAFVTACGGSEPPAAAPSSAAGDESVATASEPTPVAPADEPPPKASAADAPAAKPELPAPAFKENGSVRDAVNAVPQGTPRLNIEQEALERPLNNSEVYEPCKPGNAHFKAKVAIWDGKAVGLDLTTTPKNQKFADCIAERIRGLTWPDKVKSLNTVEYTF